MSLPFSKYVVVKDRICIGYFGSAVEHLIQLRVLRPNIEEALPGVLVWLSCRDDAIDRFQGQPRILPLTKLKANRKEFGQVYEILRDFHSHPIEKLLEESGISMAVKVPKPPGGDRCVVVTEGEPPTGKLSDDQIQRVLSIAVERGYKPTIGDDIANAAWVVGVESPAVYEAAVLGITTSLVSTGVGAGLFRKMFPGYEVLKI